MGAFLSSCDPTRGAKLLPDGLHLPYKERLAGRWSSVLCVQASSINI